MVLYCVVTFYNTIQKSTEVSMHILCFLCLGTIWTQEIVPLIMSGGDPASVETLDNMHRVPWLELTDTIPLNVEQRPSPRLLSTHMQYNMMPPSFFKIKPKVNLRKGCVMNHNES